MRNPFDPYRDYGTALLRIGLGAYYLMHAYYGGVVIGIDNLSAYNAKLGLLFPDAVAWYIVLGHLAGGALLVAGYHARLGALINLPIMAGAVYKVHLVQGFFMTGIIRDASKGIAVAGGFEYSLFLLIATVAVFFLGGGAFSLDRRKPQRVHLY